VGCSQPINPIDLIPANVNFSIKQLTSEATESVIMDIEFKINVPVSVDQFIELLNKSTLAERRPADDRECMEGMIANSNLVVTAWDDEQLVGISRCMTDFHYA